MSAHYSESSYSSLVPSRKAIRTLAVASLALGCAPPRLRGPRTADAPHSREADRQMIDVVAGSYVEGSSAQEREQAYRDYLATRGRDSARNGRWFESEVDAHARSLARFAIDAHPVTQAAFAEFVRDQNLAGPRISAQDWQAQGFVQDYDKEVRRFNWAGQKPPTGRAQHPVVLVTHSEAAAYCRWRGGLTGELRVLPSSAQFEKAARGPMGAPYPWGESYDPSRLNSADKGPRDTVKIASYPQGRSAVGAFDMAGNVFQWTSTPWPRGKGKMTVKGSAWDDHGGLGRAAASHGRGASVRHAIVGFRCASPLR